MPRTIRIHLDENCSHAIAEGLRRRGIDVTTSPEVGLLGAIDEDQLAYCLTESRVIFSYDDDFLRLAAFGVEHAGIAYCQQRKRRIGDIVRGLVLIWEWLDPADMAGRSSTSDQRMEQWMVDKMNQMSTEPAAMNCRDCLGQLRERS